VACTTLYITWSMAVSMALLFIFSPLSGAQASVPPTRPLAEPAQHFVVFDEVGQMAGSMDYIHVAIPLEHLQPD